MENCLELWKQRKEIQREIGDGIPTDNDALSTGKIVTDKPLACEENCVLGDLQGVMYGLGPILMMQITPLGVWVTVLLCKTNMKKLQPTNCFRGTHI